jgi:hypothetical protein
MLAHQIRDLNFHGYRSAVIWRASGVPAPLR